MMNWFHAPRLVLYALASWLMMLPLAVAETSPSTPSTAAPEAEIVYVRSDRGELRSGPADDFYPTGYVPRGTSLEVYHHTDDNWLGVRPPAGSFSWVPASDAYLLPGGKLIEITSQSAVSWIGTALGSAKQYRWQVQLQAGEQLRVLGEQVTEDAQGKDVLWYKIAPPSGEFRWIRANAVSSQPPTPRSPVDPPASGSAGNVVTAAYQNTPSDGVIVLGEGDTYYDPQPRDRSVMYEGEVVSADPVEDGLSAGQYGDGAIIGEPMFHDGYADGVVVDGMFPSGMPGEVWDGQVWEGPLAYQPGTRRSADPFDGWHAIDLNDDGMRLTWLERLYTRARQQGPDPLAEDPFSLAMSRGRVQPASDIARAQMMARGDLYTPSHSTTAQASSTSRAAGASRRQPRGWRDPSTLRSNLGSPVAAPPLSSLTPSNAAGELSSSLAAGFDRISGALVSARQNLTADPSSATAANTPAGNLSDPSATINWYGISPLSTAPSNVASTTENLEINQLQLTLSETVTQPMHLWHLQPIYDATRHFVEHGDSAIQRGQARLLMERIEEFADLAHRSGYLALSRPAAGVGLAANAAPANGAGGVVPATANNAAGSAAGVTPAGLHTLSSDVEQFDASGWLVPVIAASPGQPSHALTDQTGHILTYVSAIPGLNLDRYVNQAVGVVGLRGYLPQLQAGHIQAQRVVRIP